MSRRLKVLVLSYACEPNCGSEPEVGWRWVLQLARRYEVTVLTRANNRSVIESSGVKNKLPNLHFEYIDLPRWMRFWKKGNRGIHLYYVLWQILAVFRGWKIHKTNGFDLVHHLTFSPFYQPPLIFLLPIPFIWGPIGGGEKLPRAYWCLFTFRQKLRELFRILVRVLSPWNPIVYLAMKKALLILAATNETKQIIPKHLQHKVVVEPQIGMDTCVKKPKAVLKGEPFRIITAGRHVYWKGHILVLRAFAEFIHLSERPAELHVLSDGPEQTRLLRTAEQLGINDRIIFKKWLPTLKQVFEAFYKADVFVYASLLECGGYVVLEAMAQGTPVVCMNLGGTGEIVNGSCGVKIPAEDVDSTIHMIASSLDELSKNTKLLKDMSLGALCRVESEYSWDIKGDRLAKMIDKLPL